MGVNSGVYREVLRVLKRSPKAYRYIKELLRYLSFYQQLLPQTIIWRQKHEAKLCNH